MISKKTFKQIEKGEYPEKNRRILAYDVNDEYFIQYVTFYVLACMKNEEYHSVYSHITHWEYLEE